MAATLAETFRAEIEELRERLRAMPLEGAESPWREGGWTRKQILGHLMDSATNNRQRFVRAAIDGQYEGPTYGQDAWVAAHGYAEQSWQTLLGWWEAEHAILTAVVERIPEVRFGARCLVEGEEPVTLRFLIEDYIKHLHWHFRQMDATAQTA